MSRPASLAAAIARALSAAPRPPSSFWWKSRYFLPVGILHAHRDRDLRGFDRACAQHRKFLEHDFQLGIGFHQLQHVGHRAFAVAAIVVEELDEGDVAVLVAERDAARRVEDRLRVVGDARFMLFGLGGGSGACSARPSPLPAPRDGQSDNSGRWSRCRRAGYRRNSAPDAARRRAAKLRARTRRGRARRSEGIGKSFVASRQS